MLPIVAILLPEALGCINSLTIREATKILGCASGIGLQSAAQEVFPQVNTHTDQVNLQKLHPLDCSKEAIR